jgi:hypothetical protein
VCVSRKPVSCSELNVLFTVTIKGSVRGIYNSYEFSRLVFLKLCRPPATEKPNTSNVLLFRQVVALKKAVLSNLELFTSICFEQVLYPLSVSLIGHSP